MKPGPIESLTVRQTDPGIVTATWDALPEGVTYVVRWGPVGVGWGDKYSPEKDGFENQHSTDKTAFVLSGLDVGATGEIQVAAFDSRETGADRYGPISEPVAFAVTEWDSSQPAEPEVAEVPEPTPDGHTILLVKKLSVRVPGFGTWHLYREEQA